MSRTPRLTLLAALALAACGRTDPVDTPITWWHHLEGGVIAQQRPPPPGIDDPYPLIGTTPPRPTVTSAAARDALTASLVDQQAASRQLDAHDPIVVTGTPAATVRPAGKPAPNAPPPPAMAQLDAAGTPPPATPGAPLPPPVPPKPLLTPEQQEANEPVLAMPPVPNAAVIVASGPLPQMPAAPPSPPEFPGFDIPTTPMRPVVPDFTGRTVTLSNLAFQPGSDVLLPDDRTTLRKLALSRKGAAIKVDGHGDAASDTPDQQAASLRLGLARAAAAAAALESLGVPPASITLAASAFGRGGSATLLH
jgi:outer membrane protein OmpA-like peptidoglycan-associated protein